MQKYKAGKVDEANSDYDGMSVVGNDDNDDNDDNDNDDDDG